MQLVFLFETDDFITPETRQLISCFTVFAWYFSSRHGDDLLRHHLQHIVMGSVYKHCMKVKKKAQCCSQAQMQTSPQVRKHNYNICSLGDCGFISVEVKYDFVVHRDFWRQAMF